MKRITAILLCLLLALACMPAALAEAKERTAVLSEDALYPEEGEALSEGEITAPVGYDAPKSMETRRSDAEQGAEPVRQTRTFELENGFTAVLSDGVMTVSGSGKMKSFLKAADCPSFREMLKVALFFALV